MTHKERVLVISHNINRLIRYIETYGGIKEVTKSLVSSDIFEHEILELALRVAHKLDNQCR